MNATPRQVGSLHVVAVPGKVDPEAALERLSGRPMAALVRHEGMTVVAAEPDLVARDGRVWTALDPAVAPRPPGLSMAGGWIGLLSYGMGRTLEHLPRPRPFPDGPPMGVVGRYPTVAIIDGSGRARVASTAGAQACARLAECLAGAGTAPQHPPPRRRAVTSSLPGRAYRDAVERVRQHIRSGHCYQINLVQRLTAARHEHPRLLAQRLWAASGRPTHRAYLELDEGTVVSAAPELLVRLRQRRAVTSPIKGTAPPGQGATLQASAKDRSEHVMIVDLMRNDLGRCATPGSVRVEGLFSLLSTPYVEHMVSDVVARVRPGVGPSGLLRALFPGGSVTGCPKIRAMEIIHELEPVDRGPAFGSIVALGADGSLEASVAIRTAWATRDELHYWCGGAVVWDSIPAHEQREAWDKAAPFLAAIGAERPAGL